MKRIFALLAATCLLLCLVACNDGVTEQEPVPTTSTTTTTMHTTTETTETTVETSDTTETTTEPSYWVPQTQTSATTIRTTAQPLVDVKKESLSLLIIGNSHSIDAFWLLWHAYKDQHPDTDLCVGILHYNGAAIDEHVNFLNTGESVIRYYKTTNGHWSIKYNVTAESVLTDRPWDVIMMQPAKEDLAHETLNREGRYALAEAVNRYVKNDHEFVWHVSWPSPNDEVFFSPDYIRQPPVGYKDKLTRLYGFNPVTQFSLMTDMTQKWVLDDPLYSNAVCAGSAVMHALLTQGMEQLDLWRDYTHLSDYGRLMVGYAITAQLTGEPIGEVGIDVITVKWRHKQNKAQGPQTVTPAMKQGIVAAANHSLKDPWNLPPQNYPVTTTTTTEATTVTTTETSETTTATTEPITKPVVSVTDPQATDSTTEPTTEPTTRPTDESTSAPVTESTTEPTTATTAATESTAAPSETEPVVPVP